MNVPGIVAQKLECHGKKVKALIPDFAGIEIEPNAKNSRKIKSKNKTNKTA